MALAAAALAGCGSGDGFPGPIVGPLSPSFSSIQANVFTPYCEQCHSGAGAPHGLRLDAANSYALLVGVPSGEEPGTLRVKPSDPGNSYLIKKLEGTAGTGERMPAGLPPLPQADIDVIRQWIADGALQDAPQSTAPIRVTSLTPLPGSAVAALPASITAAFDRELNATTVDATTFTLVRSGGDGVFGNGNDVAVVAAGVTVPLANPATATMSLAGVASAIDTYRVTLAGAGAVTIRDLANNVLDGELGGAFPSGNGAAGGDFVAQFSVGVQPTLLSIQNGVFTPSCGVANCHTGGGAQLPTSMNLTSAAASYAALVGVASVESPGLQRVAPANPNNSYLIHKLEGGPNIAGERMPFGGAPLDPATIGAMRQWITNGAPQ
ncbi:MAG TPA: Ig-like domain-containing protein [Gammaproteobacteria bacterium]|nr:Ig-like domain-containing protein [Gammaproteobacteria bacterium]